VTKRKPLSWYDTEVGPAPNCAECANYMFDAMFVEAVHSVAIEYPGTSVPSLTRRAVNVFHANRHR
jgi:hypothetical protein